MARERERERERRRVPKDSTRRVKKRVCIFCKDRVTWVDYKDVNVLRRFMSDRGKIRARRVSGNCAQHQRDVAVAIKTARELALLPYAQRSVTERPPGRGRPRDGGEGRPREGRPGPAEAIVEEEPAYADVIDDVSNDVSNDVSSDTGGVEGGQ